MTIEDMVKYGATHSSAHMLAFHDLPFQWRYEEPNYRLADCICGWFKWEAN